MTIDRLTLSMQPSDVLSSPISRRMTAKRLLVMATSPVCNDP